MTSYIYCITNPCMKGFCKIGETNKTIPDRIKGLSNTSVINPFALEYYITVKPSERYKIEKAIHNKIVENGFNRIPGKEFFICSPGDIVNIFSEYGEVKYEVEKVDKVEKVVKVVKEVNQNIIKDVNQTHMKILNNMKKIKTNIMNKEMNQNIMKNNNQFNCDKCGKSFSRKYNLDTHKFKLLQCKKEIKEINKIIINENQCKFCNKIFSAKYNLNKHQKGHCKQKINYDNMSIKIDDILLDKIKQLIISNK